MKIFKKNICYILLLLILCSWMGIITYKYYSSYNSSKKELIIAKEECKKNPEVFKENYPYINCNVILVSNEQIQYIPNDLFDYLIYTFSFRSMPFIFPLILFIFCSWNIHKEVKSGMFKNKLLREKYSNYIIKQIIKSYKIVLVIPIFFLIHGIVCYILSDTTIEQQIAAQIGGSTLLDEAVILGPWYLVFFTVNFIVYEIALCNLSLIIAKKSQKFIITVVLSYLAYYILKVILAVPIAGIIMYFFPNSSAANYMELNNFWGYDYGCTLFVMFIYALVLTTISSFFVYRSYKSKESTVISNE